MYQPTLTSAALTFILVAALTPSLAAKCQFPSFLQKIDAWAGDYKYGLLVAYVEGDRIELTQAEEDGTSVSFTVECVQHEPGGKYLVRHKENKQPAHYRCIQFYNRGGRVVQIKASNYSRSPSSEICAEKQMSFDPYPWVQMRETTNSTTLCPFIGGYNMWVYYPPPNNSLVCSNSFLLMRMESECERGGGIVFDFRSKACVPRGLPRNRIQHARCVTHWTQDDYTFIILQHATEDREWWCLRISDPLTELKSAFLWLEVICDMNFAPAPEVSANYLRLNFHSRIFPSTCEDELEMCEETPHFCQITYKDHCAATCRECQSEKNIGECTFDEQFRGTWIDSSKTRDKLVHVDAYSVRGEELGMYSCLKLETDIMPEKRVLLELYDNGCFPRYACLEMEKVNSSVMKFRLGHRHPWPLWGVGSIKKHICHKENFLMHGENDGKERPPRLMINTEQIKEIHCGLPQHLQNGIAFNENGNSCGGCLNYLPDKNPRMFTVRAYNCTDEDKAETTSVHPKQHLFIQYSCLASFQFYNNSYSVVTKTATFAKGMGHYLVWIFTPEGHIKVMKASETFLYQSKRHLTSKDITARFTIHKNDKLKCRRYQDYPHHSVSPTSTTTTTPYTFIKEPNSNNRSNNYNNNNNGKHATHLPPDVVIGPDERPSKPGASSGRHAGDGSGQIAASTLTLTLMTSLVVLICRISHQPLHVSLGT